MTFRADESLGKSFPDVWVVESRFFSRRRRSFLLPPQTLGPPEFLLGHISTSPESKLRKLAFVSDQRILLNVAKAVSPQSLNYKCCYLTKRFPTRVHFIAIMLASSWHSGILILGCFCLTAKFCIVKLWPTPYIRGFDCRWLQISNRITFWEFWISRVWLKKNATGLKTPIFSLKTQLNVTFSM